MRRRRTIRLRNRLRFAVGLVIGALYAAWDAVNPNTWRDR